MSHMANIITCIRFPCSLALLFVPPLSPAFYALYLAAGFTDMIDGAVARRTRTASDFGARLDTAADLALVAVCLIRLLPVLGLPPWAWAWAGAIAVVRVVNIVSGFVLHGRLVAFHTAANRAAGALLFLLPLTLGLIDLKYSAAIACAVATFAAVQEGHFIRAGRDVCPTDPTAASREI